MENNQANAILKLLVIGANGGIGRQVVELALKDGHHVTAVVRNPASLALVHPSLQIIKGDVMRPETFKDHMKGRDAVISAIGVHGSTFFNDKPTTLYSEGNAQLLRAMKEAGVNRGFFISASAVEISPALPWYVRFVAKYIVQKLLKYMYADLLRMEHVIKESGINWTIIRPPQLVDKPLTGSYRYLVNEFLKNALKISRADVAHFMINHVSDEETYHGIIEIAY